MDIGQMYGVYRNQAAAAYLSLKFFIFFLSNFQTKFWWHFYQELPGLEGLKLGTQVDSGWMYGVYQNQAAAAYSSLYFLFFLSPIFKYQNFRHTFLRNCEA